MSKRGAGSEFGSVDGASAVEAPKKRLKATAASLAGSEAGVPRSEAGSSAGNKAGEGNLQYHYSQACLWMEKVDFSKMMAGCLYGQELYQVRREVVAMNKIDAHSSELCKVRFWQDFCATVTQLQASVISKHTKAKRDELIKAVLVEEPQFVWPADVQLMLAMLRLKDLVSGGVACTEEVVRVLDPLRTKGASFDPHDATLADCDVEELVLAKRFLNFLVGDLYVPLILQGRKMLSTLQRVLEGVVFSAPGSVGPILSHALAEASSCKRAISAVISTFPKSEEIADLDSVMSAREGVKHTLKSALAQNQEYKSMEASMRKYQVAHTSLGPVVQEKLKLLKQEASFESLEVLGTTFAELPGWSAALRRGIHS